MFLGNDTITTGASTITISGTDTITIVSGTGSAYIDPSMPGVHVAGNDTITQDAFNNTVVTGSDTFSVTDGMSSATVTIGGGGGSDTTVFSTYHLSGDTITVSPACTILTGSDTVTVTSGSDSFAFPGSDTVAVIGSDTLTMTSGVLTIVGSDTVAITGQYDTLQINPTDLNSPVYVYDNRSSPKTLLATIGVTYDPSTQQIALGGIPRNSNIILTTVRDGSADEPPSQAFIGLGVVDTTLGPAGGGGGIGPGGPAWGGFGPPPAVTWSYRTNASRSSGGSLITGDGTAFGAPRLRATSTLTVGGNTYTILNAIVVDNGEYWYWSIFPYYSSRYELDVSLTTPLTANVAYGTSFTITY